MLDTFARELRAGTPADLTRAARRAQAVALLALALPGLPLGGLYLLTKPAPLPFPWVAALALLAALLALAALRLAHRAARQPVQPPSRAALTAAIQAAAAPAAPFLLGCVFLAQPLALALLWLVAALACAAAWASVPGWVKAATARTG
ncbi:hypothetical protein E5F05_19900 [Deinococcus metallilatus]|uniref:Membrane protein YfcA n=1 Tax=Deinococcus metallilatus TaxID=1211322 RepID=A0AAJ5F3R7_9DEIO|nr:hypothetical protein [Deinococcus metallilatus]MBB5296312.1 putative membrane protein YfcA [Deinococcus metallilatus]QBY10004.1 hypothetical protein E5F05_19900 [Deinococcus metallilatus]RXJ08728.1 hypothetical protein ERJ73_18740 [Deinococcus metallilatus]TLK25202.1 hypothetical protein FCS05_13655 [Deinococcus metallilatus]GMA14776.1 hypothetical protein GCM10025871_11070 [Deinococcus metallilatus]